MANALDRASTVLGVGSLFPLWQIHIGEATRWRFVAFAYIFVSSAAVLHLLGRRVLKALI
jgi:hypothetical protein